MTDDSETPGQDDPVRSGGFDFGLRAIDLEACVPDPAALALVPRAFAERYQVFPVGVADRTLRLALGDPLDTEGMDLLAARLPLAVEACLASRPSIMAAIGRCYEHPPATPAAVPPASLAVSEPSGSGEHEADGPVVRQVQAIIDEAARRGASDIHVEPLARRLRVRYRIDGVLVEGPSPPPAWQAGILSRFKILANLSIAEKRLPQDGRLRGEAAGRTVDLRVSSLPTVHGESLVLRILDQSALRVGLPELGFWPDDREAFERLLGLADGIVLVTGPTGSGKTTTLYSCLHHLNRPERKIITVEDPVEYQLAGINQVPVRPEVGMTFAAALRAMLRQAPNTIMVGEIRDRETAEIALQAALTGHLVFSTLHTNDAPGAVSRLLDLGARPYLVAGALRAAVAQRLVRTVCLQCRRPHALTAAERRLLERHPGCADGSWAEGAGCPACAGSGYRGRLGLFEILPVSDTTRQIICENAAPSRLRTHASSQGMRTLREDGVRKAAAGLTTLDEVIAATVDESG